MLIADDDKAAGGDSGRDMVRWKSFGKGRTPAMRLAVAGGGAGGWVAAAEGGAGLDLAGGGHPGGYAEGDDDGKHGESEINHRDLLRLVRGADAVKGS
jgi:hypothetical protein